MKNGIETRPLGEICDIDGNNPDLEVGGATKTKHTGFSLDSTPRVYPSKVRTQVMAKADRFLAGENPTMNGGDRSDFE